MIFASVKNPQLTPQFNYISDRLSLYNLNKGIIMTDIIGTKFGDWIIISENGRNNKGEKLYSCKCKCGTIKNHCFSTLKKERSTQCKNCFTKERIDKNDLTGKKFGLFTAIERYKNIEREEWFYRCICECGTQANIPGYRLKLNHTKKCPRCRIKTHGMSRTREFAIWSDLIQRCTNPNNKNYKNYGGRGITVCERWLVSFENFFFDMGKRPQGLEIDRINNDGNYEPGNCRWATRKENCANRRISKKKVLNNDLSGISASVL